MVGGKRGLWKVINQEPALIHWVYRGLRNCWVHIHKAQDVRSLI